MGLTTEELAARVDARLDVLPSRPPALRRSMRGLVIAAVAASVAMVIGFATLSTAFLAACGLVVLVVCVQ